MEQWLILLARSSWQAGVIVLIVLAVQFILRRRLSPRLRCALWVLVAVRLVLPVSVSTAWSIFNWIPHLDGASANATSSPARKEMAPEPSSPSSQHVDTPSIVPTPSTSTLDAHPIQKFHVIPNDSKSETLITQSPEIALSPPIRADAPRFGWSSIIFFVWILVALLLFARVIVASFRFSRQCRRLQPVKSPEMLRLFEESCDLLHLRSGVQLVENPLLSSPAVHGVFSPRVMVPPQLLQSLSAAQLRFVFLHEVAHVKHRDLLVNWVATLLQMVHWFNPLIWFGFARWRADRELACDALALEAVGAQSKQEYGRTILHLLEQAQPIALPSVAGIMEDRRQLRERIKMIASFVPGRRWSLLGLAVAALLGAVALSDGQTKPNLHESLKTEMLTVPPDMRYSLTNGRSITIVVLNGEDGTPIEGAVVTGASYIGNYPERTPPSKTDISGKAIIQLGEIASIKRMQAQRFAVTLHARGFAGKGMMWLNRGEDPRVTLPAEVPIILARPEMIGGVVRDAQGSPLRGVQVKAYGSSYKWGGDQEYSHISVGVHDLGPVSDVNGRWEIPDFPKDLSRLSLEFKRPDGSVIKFSNEETSPMFQGRYGSFDMSELRSQTAAFVLSDGFTVRGTVVDLNGEPVPNVLIKEGYGMGRPQVVNHFRTDAKGRFELRNRSRREMILTAEPEKHSIGSTVITPGPDSPLATITVHPLNPLQVRLTDQDGKPVTGARVFPAYPGNASDGVWPRLEGMILDFEMETDASGVALWKNAPIANLVLTASSRALQTWRTVSFDAAATRDVTIQLRPGAEKEFLIQVKATEEGSAKPVIIDRVLMISGEYENPEVFSSPNQSEFTIPFPIEAHWKGPGFGGCKFRFEANGYASVVAPGKGWRDLNAGDWMLDLKMRPSAKPSGWVLLKDGTPAQGAVIVAAVNNSSFPLLQDEGKLYTDERHIHAMADATGFFELRDLGVDRAVLISHEKGFAETRTDILRLQPRLALEPWGKVEGILRIGDKPDANTPVHLRGGPPQGRGEDLWMANLSSVTDADGKFSIDRVPPGLNWLSRYHQGFSYQLAVHVKPGQSSQIEDGGTGRTIIAKVPAVYDWTRDAQVLVTPVQRESFPNWEDFASREAMDRANADYRRRASGEQNHRVYPAFIEKDGALRIHDVPPGKYELRLKVTEPPKTEAERFRRIGAKVLASVTREVIVPFENPQGPLDLGELKVISQENSAGAATDFEALDVSGAPLSLKKYRGKPLLIVFWAGWSKKSAVEFNAISEIARGYGEKVAVLGVNVSDEIEFVKSESTTRGYFWDQAILAGAERFKITAQFEVQSLPSVALIDRDGRLVARNLHSESLRSAVQRLVK